MKPLKMICLTGGPGAGKTAVTEVIHREFSRSIYVVPESASILYGGGFPRAKDAKEMRSVQSAIYWTQHFTEEHARLRAKKMAGIVCDRGTLDGLAYWPGSTKAFCECIGTTLKKEIARYELVIHMQSPSNAGEGYNHSNPLRTESSREARELDDKIQAAWKTHPKRFFVPSRASFIDKVDEVLSILRTELPDAFDA